MKNWHETNKALAELSNLPKFTKKAVIVIRGDGPPMIHVTRMLIDDGDVRQITEQFKLLKVGADGTAT